MTLRENLLREFCPQNVLELECDLARNAQGEGFGSSVRYRTFTHLGLLTEQRYLLP